MTSPIDSTIYFNQSLRESAEPIKSVVLCKTSGNLMTYDISAIRIWSLNKQIKSIRLKLPESLVFINMFYIDHLKCVACFFGGIKNSDEKNGLVYLVSESLIPFKYLPIIRIGLSSDQSTIVIIDKRNTCLVLQLEIDHDLANQLDSHLRLDEDSKSSLGDKRKKGGWDTYHFSKKKNNYLKFMEVQMFDFNSHLSPAANPALKNNIKDLLVLSETVFLVMDEVNLTLFRRPAVLTQKVDVLDANADHTEILKKEAKKAEKKLQRQDFDDNISLDSMSTVFVPTFITFTWSATLPINLISFNPYKLPNILRRLDSDILLIGFNDGSMQILTIKGLKNITSTANTTASSEVLCEFQAHSVYQDLMQSEHYDGVMSAGPAPWCVLSGGGSYTMEILSIGSDKKIAHWGLRKVQSNNKEAVGEGNNNNLLSNAMDPSYSHTVDLLGDYQLNFEPPSHIKSKLKNDRIVPTKCHLLPFELSVISQPIRKSLVCATGGLLIFFDILQPVRLIGEDCNTFNGNSSEGRISKNDIHPFNLNALVIDSARGPNLASGTDSIDNSIQNTVFLLKKDVIDLVSITSGKLIQQISTLNLRNNVLLYNNDLTPTAITQFTSEKNVSSVLVNGMASIEEFREQEGRPTVVYWCNLSHLVLIGYSLGGIGTISLNGIINNNFENKPFTYLKSSSIHGAEITLLLTFQHKLHVGGEHYHDVVVALIGDANGTLSVWQIQPMRTKKSPVLSMSKQHPGKIVFGHSCLVDAKMGTRVIVTACNAGVIKAWNVDDNGELSMIAFFRSDKAKLETVAVYPVMVYKPIKARERRDDQSVGSGSTISKQSLRSTLNAAQEDPIQYEIHCLCGFSNGAIESWLLSTNKLHSYSAALQIYHETTAASSKIVNLPNFSQSFANVQNPKESLFMMKDKNFSTNFLCSFVDGTACVVSLVGNGVMVAFNYFKIPNQINNIISGYNDVATDDTNNIECLLVGDFAAYEVLALSTVSLPNKWCKIFQTPVYANIPNSSLDEHQRDIIKTILEKRMRLTGMNPPNENNTKNLFNDSFSAEELFDSSEVIKQEEEGEQEENEDEDREEKTETESVPFSVTDSLDSRDIVSNIPNRIRRQNSETSSATIRSIEEDLMNRKDLVGSMESMQRIMSTELHFAKKDRDLLDLFIQRVPHTNGTISTEETVDIVYQWLKSDKILKESIWELLLILGVSKDDNLRFIEVAKVGAVVSSALKNPLKQASRKPKTYKTMKTYKTKVTYNSMGEKVVEKIPITSETMGIYDGMTAAIRKVWKQEECRVLKQSESVKTLPKRIETKLKDVPIVFEKLLGCKSLDLPNRWHPSDAHWFDSLRVIRICRTILDIRNTKQIETFTMRKPYNTVDSISSIIVKHFEHNYGNITLNVTAKKVVYFLEACLQYQYHPVVNIVQQMLQLSSNIESELLETSTWLVVETRGMLSSRGCLTEGDLIQPYNADFNYPEITMKDGFVTPIKWLLVSKNDAITCVDEILRSRGCFGPSLYIHFFNLIESLPIVDIIYSDNIVIAPKQLIDFERFLEVLFFEYIKFQDLIKQAVRTVFETDPSMVIVKAAPREINIPQPKSMIMDDTDFQTGQFYTSNLKLIHELLIDFVKSDYIRSGTVSMTTFNTILSAFAVRVYNPDIIFMHDFKSFQSLCSKRFVNNNPNDPLSYIDLIATLLAWQSQSQGDIEFGFKILNIQIPKIMRSIEHYMANQLIRYFSSFQLLEDKNPIWVMGVIDSDPSKQSGLSKEGLWNKNTIAPSDDTVFIDKVNYAIVAANIQPFADKLKVNKLDIRSKDVVAVPSIPSTDRVLTSIFGETIRRGDAKEPCPIVQKELTFDTITPFNNLQTSKEEMNKGLSRTSFSRSMGEVQISEDNGLGPFYLNDGSVLGVVQPTSPMNDELQMSDSPTKKNLDFPSDEEGGDDNTLKIPTKPVLKRQSSRGTRGDSSVYGGSIYGGSTYGESVYGSITSSVGSGSMASLSKFLAKEEVQQRLVKAKGNEDELQKLLEEEKQEFLKRQMEKKKLKRKIKKELRDKEKVSMEYYNQAVEEKFQRNMKGKEQMDSALQAEEADKKRREAEIQKILERNKERSRQLGEQKQEQKRKEEEKKMEDNQRTLMAKEDRRSAEVEKEYRDFVKQEKARKMKEQQEEVDRMMAERKAQMEQTIAELNKKQEPVVEEVKEEPVVVEEEPEVVDEVEVVKEEVEEEVVDEEVDDDLEQEGDDNDDDDGEKEDEEPIEEEPVVEEYNEEELLAELQMYEAMEAEKEPSEAEKRMIAFINRLKNCSEDNKNHPRNPGPAVFFIPQLFSEDIVFNPFAAESHREPDKQEQEQELVEKELDENLSEYTKDPFADIKAAVTIHKKELEKQRNVLYSLDDMSAAEFMRLFRFGSVKWNDFFRNERIKEQIMKELEEGEESEEDDFIPGGDLQSLSLDTIQYFAGKQNILPPSLSRIPDGNAVEITPLPTGKVLTKQHVFPGTYKYFQLEYVEKGSILTIELSCEKGSAEMYMSYKTLPMSSLFEYKAVCPPSGLKVARLTLTPKKRGTYLIGVYSAMGSRFSLWCETSTDLPLSPSLKRVDKILKKLQVLAQNDNTTLDIHFPRLYQEASMESDVDDQRKQEHLLRQQAVVKEMNSLQKDSPEKLQQLLGKDSGIDEELDDVESYVAKAGRLLMKQSLRDMRQESGGKINVSAFFDMENPNSHADLFVRPTLTDKLDEEKRWMDDSQMDDDDEEQQQDEEEDDSLVFSKINSEKKKKNHTASEPYLKLPAINTTNHHKTGVTMSKTFSHMDILENSNPSAVSSFKKNRRLKDPLLVPVPKTISYKLKN